MYLVKTNGKTENMFEICDKEYKLMLSEKNDVVKNRVLENYLMTLKSDNVNVKHISTKFVELDTVLGGGLSSGLYIIGANPGLGKTSLILDLLVNLAINKQHSLLFNLEMSSFQVMTKLLSNYSYKKSLDNSLTKMTINDLSTNSANDMKHKKINGNFIKLIKSYNEFIDPYINIITRSDDSNCIKDSKSNYVECIDIALSNYKKYHNVTPVVVIDFLQLLELKPVYSEENTTKIVDKRLEFNEIIDKLKKYSTVHKAAIILISSLSRGAYTKEISNDDQTEYSLSVFKETGHIEYTADFLALLTKGETKVSFGEEDQTIIYINVLKTRYSKHTGKKIPLKFISEYSYFEEEKKEKNRRR